MAKFIFSISLLFISAVAQAQAIQYEDQNLHERILFGDYRRGAHVKSFINKEWNVVRFEYCGTQKRIGGDYLMSVCHGVPQRELKKEELSYFTAPFLRELRALRVKLQGELRTNLVARYLTGKHDIDALDQVILAIETEGLENWILLRPGHKLPPRFRTQATSDKVAHMLAQILKDPAKIPPAPAPAPSGPNVADSPGLTRTASSLR